MTVCNCTGACRLPGGYCPSSPYRPPAAYPPVPSVSWPWVAPVDARVTALEVMLSKVVEVQQRTLDIIDELRGVDVRDRGPAPVVEERKCSEPDCDELTTAVMVGIAGSEPLCSTHGLAFLRRELGLES